MTNDLNDFATLREILSYDPATGVLVWLKPSPGRVKPGDVAGTIATCGYVRIKYKRRTYFAHRLAWILSKGSLSADTDIDHKNGDRADNRLSNLRPALGGLNPQNLKRHRKDNVAGYLGVSPEPNGKWRAQIQVDGKVTRIGAFATPELAHAAYLAVKRKLHAGCTI